jgi:hypothetical protein
MKIKSDFVTNSSSTCYIVCVPNDYHVTAIDIVTAKNNLEGYFLDDPTDDFVNLALLELPEYFEYLKEGDNLWNYGSDGADPNMYMLVAEICSIQGFILKSFDVSSEGNNTIQGLLPEDMDKWIINTKLPKLGIEVANE